MTKAQLIDKVHEVVGVLNKKQTADLIDRVFEEIGQAVKTEGRFAYPGFGTFTRKERKERKGRDPVKKVEITIKASKTVAFKPAPTLKESL